MNVLVRLRLIFIFYFILKVVIETILLDKVEFSASYTSLSPGTITLITFIVNLMLFIIGLWLFSFLIQKKNWARIILLVIGWIAIVDFFSSVFLSVNISRIPTGITPGTDWGNLFFIDFISDLLALLFWGYTIYLLQFNNNIRQLFIYEPGNNPSDNPSVRI